VEAAFALDQRVARYLVDKILREGFAVVRIMCGANLKTSPSFLDKVSLEYS
jgi:hypothetical protein